MIRIGPAGSGGLGTLGGVRKVARMNLDCMEVEFTYGVRMSMDAAREAILSARETKKKGDLVLTEQEAIAQGLKLIEKLSFCILGTNGEDGFPNIKGMTNLKHKGLNKIWFGTNTSSRRVQQLKNDNRACVYFVDGQGLGGIDVK